MLSPETVPEPNRSVLESALNPGEQLVEPPEHSESDLRDVYGYEIYPIKSESGAEGDSVLLVMERVGDAVEPVELVGEVRLIITAVMGEGIVVYNMPGRGVSANLIGAGDDMNSGEQVVIERGCSYAYLNTGVGRFVARGDSRPSFRPEYEVPVTDKELLQEFAAYGIRANRPLVRPID